MAGVIKTVAQVSNELRDNGFEALEFGVEALQGKPNARSLRVALREVSSGIELVLKGILASEHWSLMLDHPGKVSLKRFQEGDFHGAGFEECLQRVESILGIAITQRQHQYLNRMRKMRNEFEHNGSMGNVNAVNSAIGGALHAIVEIVKAAERSQILETRDLHRDLSLSFVEVSAFVDARWKELPISRGSGDPCPACLQSAGFVRDGLDCHFCNTHTEPSDAADAFLEYRLYLDAKDGNWPRYDCIECGVEALVDAGWGNQDRYRCFSCDSRFQESDVEHCSRCATPFLFRDEGMSTCGQCFSNMVNKDD